jgi:hypothetical protein
MSRAGMQDSNLDLRLWLHVTSVDRLVVVDD